MADREDTRQSSQGLDNRSFNDTFEMYENIAYGYDGTNVGALKIDSNGNQIVRNLLQDSTTTISWNSGKINQITKVVDGQTKTTTFTWTGDDLTGIGTVIT